jgi:hypothetical protein
VISLSLSPPDILRRATAADGYRTTRWRTAARMGKAFAHASGRKKLTCAGSAAEFELIVAHSFRPWAVHRPGYEQIGWLRVLDGYVSKTNLNRDVVIVEEPDAEEAANAAVVRVVRFSSSAAAA